ncbi:MAG: acylneuraminate cytidylyltransferase family protein [Muribaculum sp.]|nr:acylneuraminate cytidylyltransferase family protein [Muribaculum sp.]
MKRLAIIPARSGSKGLPDKNIIDLCGKPLMAYTIEAAIESGVFDKIIVSTDSEKYAEIARQFGAEVMMRGEELSNDKASSFMVIEDVLKKCHEAYDYFVLLQPTSPLRNSHHIQEAITLFEKNIDGFDFLVSMKEAEHANVLCKPIEEDLSLKHFDTDFSNYRRQAFKDYSPNGAIFIGRPNEYLERKHFFGNRSIAFLMNQCDSVDVDTQIDLLLASAVLMSFSKND